MEELQQSAEWYRENGKLLFYDPQRDKENRRLGLHYLFKAHTMQDREATYIVASLMLHGVLKPAQGDAEEHALKLLLELAVQGDTSSRCLLNRYCEQRYEAKLPAYEKKTEKLTDFDGKPIRIDRKGLLTPIDAQLERKDGKNVLTLRANIAFIYSDEIPNRELFEQAVLAGFRQWEGEYTVFGGQQLSVVLQLTADGNGFDSVYVMPITHSITDITRKISKVINSSEKKAEVEDLLTSKRSFASAGHKWSVHSRKFIYIQSEGDLFSDYLDLKDTAKHEFGHALGLGDLYADDADSLPGVDKGSYWELDSYYVSDKSYNLVMCSCIGPVSNNDIEMVLLAFKDNQPQLYQPESWGKKLSTALGRGN